MSISLADTVVEIRRHFRDVKWQQATLESWVRDAVFDYSKYFPAVTESTGAATTSTYKYNLAGNVFGIIEVEYPTGEDPPEYPQPGVHTEEYFFGDGVSYWDSVQYPGESLGEFWLSSPATGSNYTIKALTNHVWTEDEAGDFTCEVPDHHRPIIVQYVIWLCWREMMTAEQRDVRLGSLGKNQTAKDGTARESVLAERVIREKESYEKLIALARAMLPSESKAIGWSMDKYDRIY